MLIDLKRLRYFRVAAQYGNLNRASESLSISQSALTRSIQTLEGSIGMQLLERSPRGVRMTAHGERFLVHAQRILNAVQHAEDDLKSMALGGASELRIGISPSVADPTLISSVLFTLSRNRNITISIFDSFFDSLLQMLRLDKIEMALTQLPHRAMLSDLVLESLGRDTRTMSVYARRGHPLTQRSELDAEDYAKARWVVSTEPHYQEMLEEYFARMKIPRPPTQVFCSSLEWIKRTVLSEDFIALVSDAAVTGRFPPDSVVALPGSTQSFDLQLGLLYSPSVIRSSGFEIMREEILRWRGPNCENALNF